MRCTGRVVQLNLLLTCAALLLLLAAFIWLVPPLAAPAVAQLPELGEPSPVDDGPLPDVVAVSETISPTTIMEMFLMSSAGQWSGEAIPTVQADLDGLSPSGALYLEDPVSSWNPGGTYSMDWGDIECDGAVDRDGDLDLITASGDGVAVYVNRQGRLSRAWLEERSGLGVRWFDADRDGDSALEAVVVGDGQPTSAGTMTIYTEPEISSSSVTYTVPAQLLRVEPGDFDEDGDIDLVASTNALVPPSGCPVLLFRRQDGDPPYGGTQNPECVSKEATASLAAAYVNDDKYLDLALGLHSSKEIRVVLSNAGTLSTTLPPISTLLVDDHLAHIPYDLAWGDYNRDGWLDLAAAFPLEQEVRIYDNNHGESFARSHTLITDAFLTPLALDWADVDGDGSLELLVADLPPKIYDYDGTAFSAIDELPVQTGRIQEIRAIDADNDADLDVAVANQYTSSALFANTAPLLNTDLHSPSLSGGDAVAWGDADADGYLDLLLGGVLYGYDAGWGGFVLDTTISATAKIGAFGDFNGDGNLDVALGSPEACQVLQGPGWGVTITLEDCDAPTSFAWADYDDDGFLDLAVARSSGATMCTTVYKGTRVGDPDPFPVLWSSPQTSKVNDAAWADYDGDQWLDLAAARGTEGVQLYHHELDGSLAAGPALSDGCDARGLAWADWDGDGDEDLAVGCDGQKDRVYANENGTLTLRWESTEELPTSALAWGDWNNDGDLDLAVGSFGQKDRVYAYENGTLTLRWESYEELSTNALAWGDWDGDGDLDLAVAASDGSGWYANNYVLPVHLDDEYRPLPRNPSYLSVARPGTTPGAYFYSSPEILSPPASGEMVTLTYRLYDPDDDLVTGAFYGYSLDGGGHWIPITNVSGADLTPSLDGTPHTLYWNAPADGAVSDNARFRITIVHGKPAGPVQRASTSAVSPPFRVRATTCIWPSGLSIDIQPNPAVVGQLVEFLGLLGEGSGSISFDWDLGDGHELSGQLIHYRYDRAGSYTVTLIVTGGACPIARSVMVTETMVVESSTSSPGAVSGERRLYLPIILREGAGELP